MKKHLEQITLKQERETRIVWRNINIAADRLKVNRGHLSHVLKGHRVSKSLLEKMAKMNIIIETL